MGSPCPLKTAAERSVGALGLLEHRQQCIGPPGKLGYFFNQPVGTIPFPSSGTNYVPIYLITSFFPHLSGSLCLGRATSL